MSVYRVIFYSADGREFRCDVEADGDLEEVELIQQGPDWLPEPEPVPLVHLESSDPE